MEKVFETLIKEFSGMPFASPFSFRKNTTIGIGGEAPLALYPENAERLAAVVGALRDKGIGYVVLGRGSNVLVSDAGYRGVVVHTSRVNAVRTRGTVLTAECGAGLEKVLAVAKRNGLGGISFLCGIPASIGGAAFMNAGIRSGYIGEKILSVDVLTGGEFRTLAAKDCDFAYKHTRFMEEESVLLSVKLRLEKSAPAAIEAEYASAKAARSALPKGRSMGCVFKNPAGESAGALLERASMKGETCGGAAVAEEHANFIINRGGATSADVACLIERMKNAVFSETGIELAEEIRRIGDF